MILKQIQASLVMQKFYTILLHVTVLIAVLLVLSNFTYVYASNLLAQAGEGNSGEDGNHVVCTVEGDGCEYIGTEGIRQAIDAAASGDTVSIRSGTYTNVSLIVENKENITIRGDGENRTVVLEGSGDFTTNVLTVLTSTGVNIHGLSITNGADGISINDSTGSITQSIINNNNLSGIYVRSSEFVIENDNVISNNRINGILIDSSNSTIIRRNDIILNNSNSSLECGIKVVNSSRIVIENGNRISENGRGVCLFNSRETIISNNTISNNRKNGVYGEGGSIIIENKNQIVENGSIGIHIDRGRTVIRGDNNISRNNSQGIYSIGNHITIRQNVINNNAQNGIWLVRAISARIEGGNSISNNTLAGVRIAGIAATAISIDSNNISGNQDRGILIVNNYQTNIKNNVISNNTNLGISMSNSETIITGNTILGHPENLSISLHSSSTITRAQDNTCEPADPDCGPPPNQPAEPTETEDGEQGDTEPVSDEFCEDIEGEYTRTVFNAYMVTHHDATIQCN